MCWTGIFPTTGAFMAHNCIANVNHTLSDRIQMTTYASVPVKRGEILFVNHTDVDQGTRKQF